MAQGLGCSEACGIFLDQELNLCLLHQQVDSLPLSHLVNPVTALLKSVKGRDVRAESGGV